MQGVLLHQVRAHARQVAFRQMGQALKEQVGHREIEHRVAQELQALVVIRRKAAMGQRTLKESRVTEPHGQSALQGLEPDGLAITC